MLPSKLYSICCANLAYKKGKMEKHSCVAQQGSSFQRTEACLEYKFSRWTDGRTAKQFFSQCPNAL